ncbi:hypothetical protein Bca4012_010426 [Brassica carinata]
MQYFLKTYGYPRIDVLVLRDQSMRLQRRISRNYEFPHDVFRYPKLYNKEPASMPRQRSCKRNGKNHGLHSTTIYHRTSPSYGQGTSPKD